MSVRRILPAVVLAALGAACSDKDPAAPSQNNDAAAERLAQLGGRLVATGSPAAGFVSMAATGLEMGVQPSTVTVTTTLGLDRQGRRPDGLALSVASAPPKSYQMSAFRVEVRNFPDFDGSGTTTFGINGGVMWSPDLNEVVVVMGTGGSGTFSADAWEESEEPAFTLGALFTNAPQASWIATAGTMSIAAGSGGTNVCPKSLEGVTCTVGKFTLAYDISVSEPIPHAGNTATGSRTAGLPSTSVNGFTITLDYANLPDSRRAAVDAMAHAAR